MGPEAVSFQDNAVLSAQQGVKVLRVLVTVRCKGMIHLELGSSQPGQQSMVVLLLNYVCVSTMLIYLVVSVFKTCLVLTASTSGLLKNLNHLFTWASAMAVHNLLWALGFVFMDALVIHWGSTFVKSTPYISNIIC